MKNKPQKLHEQRFNSKCGATSENLPSAVKYSQSRTTRSIYLQTSWLLAAACWQLARSQASVNLHGYSQTRGVLPSCFRTQVGKVISNDSVNFRSLQLRSSQVYFGTLCPQLAESMQVSVVVIYMRGSLWWIHGNWDIIMYIQLFSVCNNFKHHIIIDSIPKHQKTFVRYSKLMRNATVAALTYHVSRNAANRVPRLIITCVSNIIILLHQK